jgi:hypothetical protein
MHSTPNVDTASKYAEPERKAVKSVHHAFYKQNIQQDQTSSSGLKLS